MKVTNLLAFLILALAQPAPAYQNVLSQIEENIVRTAEACRTSAERRSGACDKSCRTRCAEMALQGKRVARDAIYLYERVYGETAPVTLSLASDRKPALLITEPAEINVESESFEANESADAE